MRRGWLLSSMSQSRRWRWTRCDRRSLPLLPTRIRTTLTQPLRHRSSRRNHPASLKRELEALDHPGLRSQRHVRRRVSRPLSQPQLRTSDLRQDKHRRDSRPSLKASSQSFIISNSDNVVQMAADHDPNPTGEKFHRRRGSAVYTSPTSPTQSVSVSCTPVLTISDW